LFFRLPFPHLTFSTPLSPAPFVLSTFIPKTPRVFHPVAHAPVHCRRGACRSSTRCRTT
jgi:hypothetical protein